MYRTGKNTRFFVENSNESKVITLFHYSFPSCQGIYHHHNITYPHNQMQMYISAPPQGFQYPPPNHGNSQQPAPPFVPGSTYQSMPHPPMPPQGYAMPCAPNVQPFMMPQPPHNQVNVKETQIIRCFYCPNLMTCLFVCFNSPNHQTMFKCNRTCNSLVLHQIRKDHKV